MLDTEYSTLDRVYLFLWRLDLVKQSWYWLYYTYTDYLDLAPLDGPFWFDT